MRAIAVALTLALVAVAGCRGHYTFPCDVDSDCVRDGARGFCTPSPVDDKKYCVFPDQNCPSFRWDQTAPSSIAGVCVGEEMLDMSAGGSGGGGGGSNDMAISVQNDFAFNGDASVSTTGCSTTQPLYAVWGPSTDDIWIVGAQNTIFHLHSGMQCEAQTSSATGKDLRNVWGRSAIDVYIVGDDGVILHSVDRGATWTPGTGQGSDRGYWGIGGPSGKSYAAVENISGTPSGGELWLSTGGSWTKLSFNPPDGSPLDTVYSNGTRVWTAGGGNLYYSDDGTNWPIGYNGSGLSGYWAGVGGTSASAIVGALTGGIIVYYDGSNYSLPFDHRSGGACSGAFLGLGYAPGRAIAVGKSGCIASSIDGGASWKAFDSGSGSPYSGDFNSAWIDPVSGTTIAVGSGGTIVVDPTLPP